MIVRWLYGVAALLAVIGVLILTWQVSHWKTVREYRDRPPTVLAPKEVIRDRPVPVPGPIQRVVIRQLVPAAVGVAPDAAAAEVDSFVAAAIDTSAADTIPVRYVPFSGRLDADDRLTLWVPKSDRSLERRDFEDCHRPCSFGSTATAGPYAQTPRALPRLVPDIQRTALTCGILGGLAAGVAAWQDSKPLGWGGGTALVCVGLTLAF